MSQSPFGPAFDGNNKHTFSSMGNGLHLHDLDRHKDAFSFTSGPDSQYTFAAPLTHAYADHQPGAVQGPSDWSDIFLGMEQPGYDHGITGNQVFAFGVQEPYGYNSFIPADFGNYNNFGMSGDFNLGAINNSSSDLPLVNFPAESAPADYALDIDGEHDSDTDDFTSSTDHDASSGNGEEYPTPPSDDSAPKKGKKGPGKKKGNNKRGSGKKNSNKKKGPGKNNANNKKAPSTKTAPNTNKVAKPKTAETAATTKKNAAAKKSIEAALKAIIESDDDIEITDTEDIEIEITGNEATGSDDTGSEDTDTEDTDIEITDDEATGSENTSSEDTGSTDAVTGDSDTEETKLKKALADKEKRAKDVINVQKKQMDVAKQLGTNITVVISGNSMSVTGAYWKPPSDDTTIPSTQVEINACVDEIVAAMRNNKGCREKEDTKQFINRWADGATHYTIPAFYAAAQEVMTMMLDVHQNGWTKSVFDKDQRDLFQKTMFYTFQDRFNGVIELLKYSKTTCAYLMKGERHYSVIGNPGVLTVRTKSNKKSNKKKAVRITVGTEVEKAMAAQKGEQTLPKDQGKKRAREEDEIETQVPNDVATRPAKRGRKNKA